MSAVREITPWIRSRVKLIEADRGLSMPEIIRRAIQGGGDVRSMARELGVKNFVIDLLLGHYGIPAPEAKAVAKSPAESTWARVKVIEAEHDGEPMRGIIEGYIADGLSVSSMAGVFGMHKQTLKGLLAHYAIEFPKVTRRAVVKHTPETRQRISMSQRMNHQTIVFDDRAMSPADFADALGFSPATIRGRIHREIPLTREVRNDRRSRKYEAGR